jgi:phenylalanyl-tRNA synthetase beta chain
MRVPLSWLRDYVDVDLSPEQLAERLTLLGMEVQSIERWGSDWQNVVIGELLTVEKHPRADRLSLTTVTLGQGEPLEIVCGATNIAPGQRVPVALPGAVLPGDRRIERTEKMGVVSNGMLCSGDELNLTGDADGILILPADAPLGMALTDLYGDVVLDVDVKPNRGDALSLVGLAREVAAIDGRPIRFPETAPTETGPGIDGLLAVDVRDPDLCPRFAGRWVAGVQMGASPDRVQMRLRAAGVRPISNVVDASNYVMLELGKPVHTFDAAGIRGGEGPRRLIVRRAEAGERLETLDHVERELDTDTLVIADPSGPLAIAGVMGGASSEVSDATTDVIVESAVFDPISIRRTAKRYALRSEASLRFEKGQEFRLARVGADRTARLITEWAGGTVAAGTLDTAPNEPPLARVAFRPARVNRLLGTTIRADEQRGLLARVGVETEPAPPGTDIIVSTGPKPLSVPAGDAEAIVAVVPTWRRDIAIEADLAEEIARVHGYEQIPGILPHTPMPAYRHPPLEVREAIRETLVGAGLSEVVTHALVSPRLAETFRWESANPPVAGDSQEGGRIVTVANPLSADHSVLRPALLGSLVQVVSSNVRHGTDDIMIFEIGKAYGYEPGAGGDGEGILEWWRLALAGTGAAEAPAWDRPARAYDLDDAKGAIELIARRLRIDAVAFEPLTGEPLLHPGRAARVRGHRTASDEGLALAGWVGELHPSIVEEWELRGARVIVAEIAVAGLAGGLMPNVVAAAPSRHPAAERDLAVVVAEDRAAGEVALAIGTNGGSALESVRLFDIYRGAPLASGEKSLAYRLTFRAPDRTLAEAEVDGAIEVITRAVASEVSGRIRT